MARQHWPDWMNPAFEERFFERAREVSNMEELKEPTHQQQEITARLRKQLIPEQVELMLKWEENINYRCTLEKEWLYYAGLKDGLHIWKRLLNSMAD